MVLPIKERGTAILRVFFWFRFPVLLYIQYLPLKVFKNLKVVFKNKILDANLTSKLISTDHTYTLHATLNFKSTCGFPVIKLKIIFKTGQTAMGHILQWEEMKYQRSWLLNHPKQHVRIYRNFFILEIHYKHPCGWMHFWLNKFVSVSASLDESDDKSKPPVVQQRGRFKVTSENLDIEKVTCVFLVLRGKKRFLVSITFVRFSFVFAFSLSGGGSLSNTAKESQHAGL